MQTFEGLLSLIAGFVDHAGPLTADTPLLSTGLLDSFDIVGLVTEIEDHFGVEVPVENIEVENFDTPGRIWAVLQGEGL
jgi:D-alanine--poly(phosphoribitol) ligase subunit 2